MRPHYELADILTEYGQGFITEKQPLNYHQKVLNAITKCRTAALGGHIDRCNDCKHERISYNSCRNRHWLGAPARNARRPTVIVG